MNERAPGTQGLRVPGFALALVCVPIVGSVVPAGAASPSPGATASAVASAPAATACAASALGFATSGDSPGMGRVGILISLRNASHAPCALSGAPAFAFLDAKGATVANQPSRAAFVLAPGATAYSHAVWSDGTGGNGPCADATTFTLTLEGDTSALPQKLSHKLSAHICSLDETKPSFIAYAFALSKEPVPLPSP